MILLTIDLCRCRKHQKFVLRAANYPGRDTLYTYICRYKQTFCMWTIVCSKHTSIVKSKLSANNLSIKSIPEVITHCAIVVVMANFHSPLCGNTAIHQLIVTLHTVCSLCRKRILIVIGREIIAAKTGINQNSVKKHVGDAVCTVHNDWRTGTVVHLMLLIWESLQV